MKNKRGMSHLELITAMLIFLFAVVLVIYFINVSIKTNSLEPVLNALEIELREQAEIDYNKTPLYVRDLEEGCFEVHLHSDLSLEEKNVLIENMPEDIPFHIIENKFSITNNNQNLYEIYSFSEDVTDEFLEDECDELTEGQDYNYGITYCGKMFSQEKLLEIELGYEDFRIDIDGDYFKGKENIPEQAEVYAKNLVVDILIEEGIEEVIINLKIW